MSVWLALARLPTNYKTSLTMTMTVMPIASHKRKETEVGCDSGEQCVGDRRHTRTVNSRSRSFTGFNDKLRPFPDQFVEESASMESPYDMSFIVQLTGSAERRLRCQSLEDDFTDCGLEECADGAVIMTGEESQWRFGNKSCVEPFRASIVHGGSLLPAPVCTCLRVITAVSALGVWRLGSINTMRCGVRLTKLQKGSSFKELASFSFLLLIDLERLVL